MIEDKIVELWNQLHHQGRLYLIFSVIYVVMGIVFICQIDELIDVMKEIAQKLK